jgi:hypothetical protein
MTDRNRQADQVRTDFALLESNLETIAGPPSRRDQPFVPPASGATDPKESGSHSTGRWRGADSNFPFRARPAEMGTFSLPIDI